MTKNHLEFLLWNNEIIKVDGDGDICSKVLEK